MKLILPTIDVWSGDYIRKALLKDRCSCAPDTIHTIRGSVYIGNLCLRHDDRYAWIWRQKGWWRRIRLKWMADRELAEGIREAFAREGIHEHFIPWAYKTAVVGLNFPFRLVKEIGAAIVKAVTFRG